MATNSLSTVTYRSNPEGSMISVFVGFFLLGFVVLLLYFGLKASWLAVPLVAFALYRRQSMKTRQPDPLPFIFSIDGIQYGERIFRITDMEDVAIDIYAFDGFEYRDGFGTGSAGIRARGDKNVVSFRVAGDVHDFNFYLADYADFCTLKKVMDDWITAGISVAERQEFSDEFIQREMNYFGTDSGIEEESD
ncbi:MAG TPA: hypothetical protein VKR32_12830 [Puia sp.]|nr:hypothetical protein [Puia sp.]